MNSSGDCLAVDIGATKVDIALVNASGQIEERSRLWVREHDNLADAIIDLGRPLLPHAALVGVGTCGPLEDNGKTVSPLNIPQWRAFPLGDVLGRAWSRPVAVDLDTKALARAEGHFGRARGVGTYLSMVISSGVGGGFVLDGKLVHGAVGNAGHIGHLCVDPHGHECSCGARGCLEAEIGGLALARRGIQPEHASDEVREECARTLGQALASVAALVDCPTTYIGGSIGLGWGSAFAERVQHHARVLANKDFGPGITVTLSSLGEDGGLLGAALVGWHA